ncbi:hypothetical protein QQ045_001262 [Rhodiola kirilowii]
MYLPARFPTARTKHTPEQILLIDTASTYPKRDPINTHPPFHFAHTRYQNTTSGNISVRHFIKQVAVIAQAAIFCIHIYQMIDHSQTKQSRSTIQNEMTVQGTALSKQIVTSAGAEQGAVNVI